MRGFQAYGVVEDTAHKDRLFLGLFDTEQAARNRVRDGIASGCLYGYVKQGPDVIAYLTVESFTVHGLIEKAEAEAEAADRGKRTRVKPLLRVE